MSGRYVTARRRGLELRWRGVIVGELGVFVWSCEHAHMTTIAARACARVELEDAQRAERRRRSS